MRRVSILLTFFCFFLGAGGVQTWADFYGDSATGLLQLEKKYPYYLFVPADYSPEKAWPLVLILAERGEDPKTAIEPWLEWAKQRKLMVAALPQLVPEHEVPTAANEWLIKVKREMVERYRVNPANILLVGRGSSGHYVAYVGLNFPKEFSGIASIQKAWAGPFEKLMRSTRDRSEQADFYAAVDPKEGQYPAIERKALELQGKGYQIKVDTLNSGGDWLKVRDSMIQWFLENSESRSMKVSSKNRTAMKGKIQEVWKNLFQM